MSGVILEKKSEKPHSFDLPFHDEEGEVAFIGEHPFIVDPDFKFRTDNIHKINWKSISKLNLSALKHGASFEELNNVFRAHVEDLAYCDLKEEQRCVWISHEGLEAMRVMQLSIQYLLSTQNKLRGVIQQKEQHVQQAVHYVERLKAKRQELRQKALRYERLRHEQREQAVHFELLLNKLSPEILHERVFCLMRESERQELLADEESVFRRILKAKGVIAGESTNNDENMNPNRVQANVNNKELEQ
jgi:hypothetical protein